MRPFRKEYQDEVVRVIASCYSELGWELDPSGKDKDLQSIAREYQVENGQFWTLWIDRKISGTIALQKHGDYYHLRRFYLLAQYRNRGLGKLMVSQLLEHARLHDIHSIQLSTKERESAAYHIFLKAGFTETTHTDLALRCHIFMKKED